MRALNTALLLSIFLFISVNVFAQETTISTIAQIPLFEEVNDVDIYGDYLFVNNELEFDISTPPYPVLFDSLFIDQNWYINPVNIEFFDNYCLYHSYTMEYENKLVLLNVADMTSPNVYWSIIAGDNTNEEWGQVGEEIKDMTIDGSYAYLALPIHHLAIVSLASGRQSFLELDGVPTYRSFGVEVENEIAYLTCGEYGLHLIDVSDMDHPFEISTYTDLTDARDIDVHNGYAYICDATNVEVIDVNNSFTPTMASRIITGEIVHKVVIKDNLAFLCNGRAGIQVLDIEDPSTPIIIQHIDIDGDARDISFHGDDAYIADCTGQVHIVNISDINSFPDPSPFGQSSGVTDMTISGDYLIGLSGGKYPVNIYNMENPYQNYTFPLFEDYHYHDYDRIAASEDCLYLLRYRRELYMYDMSDHQNPVYANMIDLGDERYNNLLVQGSFLILLEGNNHMKVYDISDPFNPTVSGYYPDQVFAGVEHLKVYDDILFLSAQDNYQTFNLQWIDISDPANPVFYPAFSEFNYIYDFARKDDYLFIGHGEETITILDISNRSLPVISSDITLDNNDFVLHMETFEDYLMAFVNNDGFTYLDIYDITDGSDPIFISRQKYSQISSSTYPILEDNIYITQGRALEFTEFILPGSIPTESPGQIIASLPMEFGIAKAYPNPFNPSLNVEISLPQSGLLQVNVFNMLGQKVANLTNQPYQAGTHIFTFDGSNLSSGVYFVKASLPGQTNQIQKVVLMK